MIDEIPGAVVRPRIRQSKRPLERNRHPHQVRAFCERPRPCQRIREQILRHEYGIWHRLVRIRRAGLLHDVVAPIHFVMPRAAVPMIAPHEIQHAWPSHIQRDIKVVRDLIQKMARVRPFISTAPIVRAAHIRPRANPLIRPFVPHATGVRPHGNHWRLRR